jgi:hypothetical protein
MKAKTIMNAKGIKCQESSIAVRNAEIKNINKNVTIKTGMSFQKTGVRFADHR